jgi:hypothetical protein
MSAPLLAILLLNSFGLLTEAALGQCGFVIVPVDLACKSRPAERDISQCAGLILCRR